MDNRSHRRFRKFYQDQVKEVLGLIKKQYTHGQLEYDTYLDICEQKGIDPDPNEMPPTLGDYPLEVQVAFLLHDLLPDRWEGMSGSYLGKDYSSLGLLLDIWEVEDKQTCIYFIKHIEANNSRKINEELENKRKANERKAKAGAQQGKSGINVQG